MECAFGVISTNYFQVMKMSPLFFLLRVTIFALIFRSRIPYELNFV